MRANAQVDAPKDISAEELLKVIGEYDAMIVRGRTKVVPAVFDAARKLRAIGRAGVGVDNIDLNAAKAHHVTVVNAPQSTSLAVAELTIGLMFSLARMIPRADSTMKAGQWIKKELEGVELNGKTLGIIGMGNIGSAVAQRCGALGMIVLGYDALVPAESIHKRGAEPVALDELYNHSDFISLHIPLTAETRGLIGAEAFNKMKKGVRFVTAARGGIVDEAALLEALNSGQVAASALDVFIEEPPKNPTTTALVAHPRVVATPHIGAQSEEAQTRASADIAFEVLAALKGENLRWKVV